MGMSVAKPLLMTVNINVLARWGSGKLRNDAVKGPTSTAAVVRHPMPSIGVRFTGRFKHHNA